MPDPLRQYLRKLRDALRAGTATEQTHRPALKALVETLRSKITATNEPKHVECGAPDFAVAFHSDAGSITVGHIETKDIAAPLDQIERTEQLKRYLRSLPNLILTDYLEFRWYVDGELRQSARLARQTAEGKLRRDTEGAQDALDLLGDFLAHSPEPIARPRDLAERMARLTHIVRDTIIIAFQEDKASSTLTDLRSAFARTLIPDLDQPEHTAQFADMFAQTIAYGLFAARCNHDDSRGPFRRLGAAAEIPKTNPFLRQLFETITGNALNDEPYVGFVEDLVTLLAHTNIDAVLEQFGRRTRREDPVVHFYETFLSTYDPGVQRRRGVYYTPEPVVSYIVRSVDHILRTRFGLDDGLADTATVTYTRETQADNGSTEEVTETAPRVLILDPACGTGTFLYAVVDHIREQFIEAANAGMWSGYVRNHLLPRLFGFELLMAPYAVAHLKLG
ncbi:MAG: DNA methyltransferase, partial [Planctomycetota bacterium]